MALTKTGGNYFLFSLLIFSLIGIFIGDITGVEAGTLYLTIAVVTISILVYIMVFVGDNKKDDVWQFFKIPFQSSTRVSIFMFYVGFLFMVVLNLILNIVQQGFSTVQFMSPLFFSSSTGLSSGISQTFSASVIESSPFAIWFYTVFVAGIQEEFTFGFAIPLMAFMIAIFINKFALKDRFGKNFYLIFSLVVSVVAFSLIHQLNSTYVGIMFIIAGLFRLLMNLSIYYWGFGLAFAVGIHMSNNNLAYIQLLGFQPFMIIPLILLLLGFVLLLTGSKKEGNIDSLWKEIWAEMRRSKYD